MNKNIIKKTYEIECLSPVHIGNGEKLKPFEYLYDKYRQMAYFMDETRWLHFLAVHHLTESFASHLMRISDALNNVGNYQEENLWDWLLSQGMTEEEISSLGFRAAQADPGSVLDVKDSLNEIAGHSSLANGQPYIPGSSIKGALRTGLLYGLLQKQPEVRREYAKKLLNIWEEVRVDAIGTKMKELQRLTQSLETELLSKLKPNPADFRKQRVSAMNRSIMRGLIVGDGMCVNCPQETIIVKKVDASTHDSKNIGKCKTLPLSRECLPKGAKLRLHITVDASMLAEAGISGVEEILDMTREFTQATLLLQKKIFGADYVNEFAYASKADMFLGGGTGYLASTLTYALLEDEAATRDFVKAFLHKRFDLDNKGREKRNSHRHDILDLEISPRTLKLTQTGGVLCLMGLCRMQEVSLC